MADFSFYTQEYLGADIPQNQFDRCMARAKEALAAMERRYTVTGGTAERKLALCAMAEAVYKLEKRRGVVSAAAGSVSVRYGEQSPRQLWRELFEQAAIYLEISRGVG